MMYPFMTLDDGSEIVHSEMKDDGRVKVYIEKPDAKDAGTITLKIQNNSNLEMRTFGLPSLIIDGRSIALDPYANMSEYMVTIPAHSYAELTYYVDDAVFEDGGIITGQMHSMDPTTNSDNTYRLELCR